MDGFDGFLEKHITVKCEVCEKDEVQMAAIASMRPKKSSYKVQAHPVRSNLLSIVPVEEQPESKKPKLFSAVILPNKRNSESPGKSTTTSKFNRHNDENNESSDLSSSEEEIEVEEEVTATESESEEQSTTKKGKKTQRGYREVVCYEYFVVKIPV